MIFKYIHDTAEARIQNWQSRHFELTKYGRSIVKLKNCHKDDVCFVIGNGPSLSAADLQELYVHQVPCFATNRVYKIFNQTEWRPQFFVSEDVIILRSIQHEVEALPSEKKFIPINLKWYEEINICDADYFYLDYNSEFSESFGLSLDCAHAVKCCATVTTTCIQFAIYMGFSKIFLLGVDHSFAKMIDKNGNVVVDSTIRNHFTDDYDKDIVDQGFQVDSATEAYMNIERLSRKLGTFRVFNATRGGKLEVFERVDFDDLFKTR